MKDFPLVSICIPTYNNARYLRECLDSIATQTYPNIEVLVGDDCSSDQTASIAQEYVDRYGYSLYKNAKNEGGAATSSILIGKAKGEYVAVYHSDDRYEPNIVEESVKRLKDSSVGLVASMADIIDENGNCIGEFKLHDFVKELKKTSYSFDDVLRGVLKNSGRNIMLVTPSVMVPKKIYQELGLYQSGKYGSAYDYEMWLRIARKYNVAVIDRKLMNYRIHENQISELQIRRNVNIQGIVWVLRDYEQYIGDYILRKDCLRLLDKWIFRTAKRQNYMGFFEKSNQSLEFIQSRRYMALILLIKILNTIHLPIKKKRSQIKTASRAVQQTDLFTSDGSSKVRHSPLTFFSFFGANFSHKIEAWLRGN